MGMVTQNYMEALGKQVFARDFMLNGLFPCNSPIARMLMMQKVEWKFNDRFEYRMLMANSNSGGTVNTQTFKDNGFQMAYQGAPEYATFQATFGALMDGFTIDMLQQLETVESKRAFNSSYATLLHSMRINVASMFKNYLIYGRYGHCCQIRFPLRNDGYNGTGGAAHSDWDANEYINGIEYNTTIGADGRPDPSKWYPATFHVEGSNEAYWKFDNASAPVARADRASAAATPKLGMHIRIHTDRATFNTNFKNGKLLARAGVEHQVASDGLSYEPLTTTSDKYNPSQAKQVGWDLGRQAPWGLSLIDEMYVVYDNQPKVLEIVCIGQLPQMNTTAKPTASDSFVGWRCGDYLIPHNNRKAVGDKATWDKWSLVSSNASASAYVIKGFNPSVSFYVWAQNPAAPADVWDEFYEHSGAFEGLGDIIPFYSIIGEFKADERENRMGLDRAFRGQPNRLRYMTEQAGMMVFQQKGQSIMDTIMDAVELAISVCDEESLAIYIHPTTLTAISMYEGMYGGNGGGVQVIRDSTNDGKLMYQRGITSISMRIGERVIPNVYKDPNLPTDIIMLMPKNDLSYNCWDNSAWQLTQYIKDTWKGKPPKIEEVKPPAELCAKLDLSSRIIYDRPISGDLTLMQPGAWGTGTRGINSFVHPSNAVPVAYQELGALFTENPYAYTVVKLRNKINTASDIMRNSWSRMMDDNV